ncbi:DUF6193 family natural product biosynthesis protein [Kitasatospora sp. SC0581]|uniref:DUF6193 family natural product biosynthesis protein n=1 Tax=Kitasatospora sp. SC0581 TaxID=3394360 RepID=UPI003A837668
MPEQTPVPAADEGDALRPYAAHYPDVARAGSLLNALRAQADRAGLRLGGEPAAEPGRRRTAARVTTGDRLTRVGMTARERSFDVSCWVGGVHLATGSTGDLAEAAGAVATWQAGARLAELLARWPFLRTWGLAEAHERGDAVPVRWRRLRESATHERRHETGLRELVEAAHAQPRLRALSPGRSMYWLTFSRRAAPPISYDLPRVAPLGDGRYRVRFDDGRLQDVDGAEAAVAAVVDALPDDAVPS